MIKTSNETAKVGSLVIYNDGRAGHSGVKGVILAVGAIGMTVQFEDRADTNYIKFADLGWMNHITIEPT
jgi:hypothetical protein